MAKRVKKEKIDPAAGSGVQPEFLVPTFNPQNLADFANELASQPLMHSVFEALLAGRSATIDGAWGSAAGLAVGALASRCPGVLLVAVSQQRDLDPWRLELESFTGRPTLIFPALSCLPGEEERVDPATPARLRVLGALAGVG